MVVTGQQPATLCQSFCVCGFRFELRTVLGDAYRLICGLYGSFTTPDGKGPASEAVVDSDGAGRFAWRLGGQGGTSFNLSSALWNLEAALCEAIIRSQTRSAAIHAATLRTGDSLLLLAGRSQSGKTTLSLALAHRGLQLAGDDVALVEPETALVQLIPRCFHLDDNGAALLEADGFALPDVWRQFRFFGPNDLAATAPAPLRTRNLVFLRGPRASRPVIVPLSQAEMTAHLLSETGKGPLTDSETVAAICRLTAGSSCFLLTPGPLSETAAMLVGLFRAGKHAEDSKCLPV